MRGPVLAGALLFVAVALAGCDNQDQADASKKPDQPAPAVIVAPVTKGEVSDSVEFVGQTEAFQSVDIRARVTGFLLERNFQEGSEVKKDDILFVIDPSEFEAARDSAAAKVERVEATIEEAQNQLERYRTLTERGTTSEAALDQAKAKEGEAKADLAAAKADLENAKLNLGYTKIKTPISGRIGASEVDVGNLIGPDSGVLATVVALDPIKVSFPVSEREYLNYSRAKREGNADAFVPKIILANGELYSQDGKLDFIDNRVDPATGTIRVHVQFPNPHAEILPGQFVNVRLVSSEPKQQILIPQVAVQENQAGSFVLVVNADNKVEMRPIKTGQRDGPNVSVTEGLTAGEMLIVDGIQKVRPGVTVDPVPQTKKAAAS